MRSLCGNNTTLLTGRVSCNRAWNQLGHLYRARYVRTLTLWLILDGLVHKDKRLGSAPDVQDLCEDLCDRKRTHVQGTRPKGGHGLKQAGMTRA
jgi:hypothetical protein